MPIRSLRNQQTRNGRDRCRLLGLVRLFNGISTSEVMRIDGLLGVTPIAIGDLILVQVVQGFRQEKAVATARQLFRLAPLSMLGARNAWKAAENYRELRRRGITVRNTID